jgi:hypothetical protein
MRSLAWRRLYKIAHLIDFFEWAACRDSTGGTTGIKWGRIGEGVGRMIAWGKFWVEAGAGVSFCVFWNA